MFTKTGQRNQMQDKDEDEIGVTTYPVYRTASHKYGMYCAEEADNGTGFGPQLLEGYSLLNINEYLLKSKEN